MEENVAQENESVIILLYFRIKFLKTEMLFLDRRNIILLKECARNVRTLIKADIRNLDLFKEGFENAEHRYHFEHMNETKYFVFQHCLQVSYSSVSYSKFVNVLGKEIESTEVVSFQKFGQLMIHTLFRTISKRQSWLTEII